MFRYTFEAENSGTHFWHSHIGMQRGDGAFGALIVREPRSRDPHSSLYDLDLSEHILIVQDWTHLPGTSVFTAHHHGRADNKPPNILINGKGKYFGNVTNSEPVTTSSRRSEALLAPTTTDSPDFETIQTTLSDDDYDVSTVATEETTRSKNLSRSKYTNIAVLRNSRIKRAIDLPTQESPMMPYEIFFVDQGMRYRFRTINSEYLNCPVEISIDNHNFTVIASDGYDFQPVEVSSMVTYAGERFDIIINADKAIGNYWIRIRGLMDCDERFTSAYQVAILRYRGAPLRNPEPQPQYNYTIGPGIQLNALNKGTGEKNSLSIAELNSVGDIQAELFRREPDFKFFVYYDFYPKDNPLFHDERYYGFQQGTIFIF
jgi:FtsP/CotA-like multicopper oxidase with cupredoxin domain